MRKLLLAIILLMSPALMADDIMSLALNTLPLQFLKTRQISAVESGSHYGTCSIGVRATVGTVDADNSEDHWLVWLYTKIGLGALGLPAPRPPGGVPSAAKTGWSGTGHGTIRWVLRNNATPPAKTASGVLGYNGDRSEFAELYMRLGVKAAAPADLASGTEAQPILHLDKANYDQGSLTIIMSGDYVGSAGGNRIALMQIHNDGEFAPDYAIGEAAAPTPFPETRLAGNGHAEIKYTINIGTGTENLCEHIGAGG